MRWVMAAAWMAAVGGGAPGQASGQAPAPVTAGEAQVSVVTWGAKGDGKADDTAAFGAAVAEAKRLRRPVFVPRGNYRVAKPIVLDGMAMVGPEGGAWNSDGDALPVLTPTHRDGPCVQLGAGGGLRGICIRYEWAREPEAGPAAVLITGVGAFVSNAKIMYPWDGIMTDGVSNVGRLHIENVFMVAPRNVGVRVTGTWDVPSLRNVEVWNAGPVPRGLEKGIGFDLGKNDLIRVTDCFAFAMQTGFLLRDEIPGCKIKGGTWGVLTGCATDFCGRGIEVRGENTVSISGGTFWDHGDGLFVDGDGARVRLTGAEVKSNGGSSVVVRRADQVTVNGCSLIRNMKGFAASAVVLQGGRTTLTGCQIEALTAGVEIGAGVRAVTLQGNTISAAAGKGIVDPAGPRPAVVASGNGGAK